MFEDEKACELSLWSNNSIPTCVCSTETNTCVDSEDWSGIYSSIIPNSLKLK